MNPGVVYVFEASANKHFKRMSNLICLKKMNTLSPAAVLIVLLRLNVRLIYSKQNVLIFSYSSRILKVTFCVKLMPSFYQESYQPFCCFGNPLNWEICYSAHVRHFRSIKKQNNLLQILLPLN